MDTTVHRREATTGSDDEPTHPARTRRAARRATRRSERGAGIVEYALLVTLIAIACITAVEALGDSGVDSLENSRSEIDAAST